jgi:hypothetical protein
MEEIERQKKVARSVIKNTLREFPFWDYGLDIVDETKLVPNGWVEDLAAAIVGELYL